MASKGYRLFPGMMLLAVFLVSSGGSAGADPLSAGDSGTRVDNTAPGSDLPKVSAVKNPHGFLEFDGTGYRVVTRDVKPEKASHVRLKPVARSKGDGSNSTLYTLEVLDDKPAEADRQPAEPAGDRPRLAVERVEDMDKKGVAAEPRKEHKADVGVGVKVSESSEVMVGRGLVVERKDDKGIDSRDDGWRFRFKTNF